MENMEKPGKMSSFYGKTWENAGISMENMEKPENLQEKPIFHGKNLGFL